LPLFWPLGVFLLFLRIVRMSVVRIKIFPIRAFWIRIRLDRVRSAHFYCLLFPPLWIRHGRHRIRSGRTVPRLVIQASYFLTAVDG
jgi:hypothetical protein